MRRRVRAHALALALLLVPTVALWAASRALAAGASDAASQRNRAAALLDNGEDAKAIEAFRDLARRFPDSAPDRVNLAIALINHNDLDGAESELRAALAKSPDDLRAHFNLGLVLKKRGKNEEAAKEMAPVAASSEGQRDATVWYQLGLLYKRLRRSDDALAAFRKAVALQPEHSSAHFQIYNELIQRGEKAAAQPELEEFKILQKATPEFQRNEAYLERGAFTKIDAPGPGSGAAAPQPAAASVIRFEVRAPVASRDADATASGGALPAPSAPGAARSQWSTPAALADFDGDGALDIAVAAAGGSVRIYRQQPPGTFTQVLATLDASKTASVTTKPEELRVLALAAADIDNDGDVDVLIASASDVRLYLNAGKARFVDATKDAGLVDAGGAASAVWLDADRDGDLDLALGRERTSAPSGAEPAAPRSARLYLNAGLFPEAAPASAASSAVKARFMPAGGAALFGSGDAIAASDLRGRDDPDLVLASAPGSRKGFLVERNLRGGRFREEAIGRETSLSSRSEGSFLQGSGLGLETADLDGDGRPELLAKDPTEVLIHWNDGTGAFSASPDTLIAASSDAGNPHGGPDIPSATVLDADGDGRMDVAVLLVDPPREGVAGEGRVALFHNEGARRFTALAAVGLPGKFDDAAALVSGDLDGDGDPDLAVVTPDAPPIVLANVTKTSNRWIKVSLKGGKTNRNGLGARIEVRADRLFASRESDGNPTIIGVGPRGRADAVRVDWTSGVTQDLIDVPAGAVKIDEKREFSGSCPFLYAWDGTTFRFVGEALSGAPVGFLRPDGAYEAPRPMEHLRLPPGLPVARGGRLSLRLTEEMRELTALDVVRLVAVDHPASVEVYSNERLTEKIEPFAYVAVTDLKPAAVAREQGIGSQGGTDATAALEALDDRAASGFMTLGPRLEGLAEPHVLDLTFQDAPPAPYRLALVLDGWLAWTTSDVSRALLQAAGAGPKSEGATNAREGDDVHAFAGITLPASPNPWGPALEMRAPGAAPFSLSDMGLPIGPAMLVPLRPAGAQHGTRVDIRIGTSLAVYYDRIRLGRIVDAHLTIRELFPVGAELRWRGVAAERRTRDDETTRPDYEAVSPLSPFPRFDEETTPLGDVLVLVSQADNQMAVLGTGDEVALEFDAGAIPPPGPGMARTWFLVSTGYARDGDPNTRPLPWGPAKP